MKKNFNIIKHIIYCIIPALNVSLTTGFFYIFMKKRNRGKLAVVVSILLAILLIALLAIVIVIYTYLIKVEFPILLIMLIYICMVIVSVICVLIHKKYYKQYYLLDNEII